MKKKLREKLEKKRQAPDKIRELFDAAASCINKSQKQADDYVRKARNLMMKFRLKAPGEFKRKFCKHCYAYLKPGVNCRVRTRKGMVVYYCLNCKRYMRFSYRKHKQNGAH